MTTHFRSLLPIFKPDTLFVLNCTTLLNLDWKQLELKLGCCTLHIWKSGPHDNSVVSKDISEALTLNLTGEFEERRERETCLPVVRGCCQSCMHWVVPRVWRRPRFLRWGVRYRWTHPYTEPAARPRPCGWSRGWSCCRSSRRSRCNTGRESRARPPSCA